MLHPLPGENEAILSWNAFNRFGIFVLIAYSASLQAQLGKALEKEKALSKYGKSRTCNSCHADRQGVQSQQVAREYSDPVPSRSKGAIL